MFLFKAGVGSPHEAGGFGMYSFAGTPTILASSCQQNEGILLFLSICLVSVCLVSTNQGTAQEGLDYHPLIPCRGPLEDSTPTNVLCSRSKHLGANQE